jgi:hypothetical protein
MSEPRTHRVPSRLLIAVTAVAVAFAGVAATAPAANATGFRFKAQFTATVSSPDTATSPVVATVGTPIRLDFLVTNTSNFFAPIGRIVLTAPTGFSVATATVNRTGWKATIKGQVITASIARPLTPTGLRPGQSLTIEVLTTASSAAVDPTLVQTPATWAVQASCLIRFTLVGPAPTIVVVSPNTAAFAASPGVPLDNIAPPAATGGPCVLDPGNPVCSTADLPNGAAGNVYFSQEACAQDTDPTCPLGTEIDLSGAFASLYNDASPGLVSITCLASTCPHPDSEPPDQAYDYNFACLADSCSDGVNPFGEREVEEDFAAYPVFVELKGSTEFAQAPRCVPVDDLTTTGKITDAAAIAAGFCVDVNAITRTDDSFSGDLIRPVLFVEDPKMR